MLVCECGGTLLVIAIEEPPEKLSKEQKLTYNRVCDVECQNCGKIYYSQPYDFGLPMNEIKETKEI